MLHHCSLLRWNVPGISETSLLSYSLEPRYSFRRCCSFSSSCPFSAFPRGLSLPSSLFAFSPLFPTLSFSLLSIISIIYPLHPFKSLSIKHSNALFIQRTVSLSSLHHQHQHQHHYQHLYNIFTFVALLCTVKSYVRRRHAFGRFPAPATRFVPVERQKKPSSTSEQNLRAA